MATESETLKLTRKHDGKILEIHVQRKLTKEDYEMFVPEVERLIAQHGKLRILFDMEDFHGWSAGALWKDTTGSDGNQASEVRTPLAY